MVNSAIAVTVGVSAALLFLFSVAGFAMGTWIS